MAQKDTIVVETSNARNLHQYLIDQIDRKEITTWEYDKDHDFVFRAAQYAGKAYIHSYINKNKKRVFAVRFYKGKNFDQEVAAIYLGHFLTMLINHCGNYVHGFRVI